MKKEINKEVPEVIKVLSIVSFIIVGLFFIFGLGFINFGESSSKMGSLEKSGLAEQGIILPSASVLVSIGIIFLILSVLFYFIGKGLLNAKKWAKIVIAVIAIIFLIMALMSLINKNFSSIIFIVINGFISWYLLLNKESKKFFD